MPIKPSLDQLNNFSRDTMVDHLGIEFTEIGDTHISARMPVDRRTIQPFGLLHGGASVALAETLGSIAAQHHAGLNRTCVGVEINANHLKSARNGYVYGTAKPIRLGNNIQVWGIEITNEGGDLICVSRLTVAVLDKK